ncbi:class I SAM-dependent methyltransferase [Aquicella lusitana]|uniref:Methyltransferase family protein n=1 Tax=Aquicella lusitana TaxID=254246 RepID=A0A370GN77_9COXI|nr:class I SAM-dependent methyltransferase [Aquicella lusitana]RDI44840.1 hypothetical protein C8D86_10894 [Aquicella lusitana]VVC73037.1 hypothetical protein AQULUS_07650 [Aquicella lusitana]
MDYMLTSSEKHIASEWEKYKGYTVRPVPSTLSYYRQHIHSLAAQKSCVILGGTPEIRDIFQAEHRPVTLIDQSEEMVRAMGWLTAAKKPLAPNEQFSKQNWLTVALTDPVDLVVGDDAINMVSWDEFPLFLSRIWQLLNKEGIFICHLLVKPDDELIDQEVEDVWHAYQTGLIKSTFDLASCLNFICFDKPSYRMGWQQTISRIGKDRLAQFKPELDFVDRFQLCNSRFCCPPQSLFEAIAEKYFTIEEIFYPHEHAYCLFEPVYLLRKKQG